MKKSILTLCSLALIAVSCKKEDTPETILKGGMGNYLLETSLTNDGMSGSSYLQLFGSLSGTIDNSLAEQVEFGSSVQVEGNNIYLFDTIKSTGGVILYTYDPSTKRFTKKAHLSTPANSMVGNLTIVSPTKAYLPLYGIGVVWIINPQTLEKKGEISLTKYAHGDTSPDPAMGILHNGKYYLSLTQINPGGGWQPYADYLQCDVAIINPQTDVVEKVISETTSGLTFPTRPMAQCRGMMFVTETKDLYIATVGYFGFNPANKKSGFICIPNANTVSETEFDTAKTWDISTTTIEGTTYKPACVLNAQYMGSGKVAAYVGISELYTANPYTAKSSMAVIIDLNAKTIKQIEGIPLTDGYSVFISKYKDKAVFAAFGTDKRGLFLYDPATGTIEQILTTVGNPAFFHEF